MGAVGESGAPGNVWRDADDWPPAGTPTALFLRSGGVLAAEPPDGDEEATRYTSDPRHPMEIPETAFPGARDARAFETQPEVRTFTTEPLDSPVEWTGRVRAELCVSSTAHDTDFIVRLSDVYPDGRSILIMDYVRRARYRDGFDRQVLMEPGNIYNITFDVGWLSQVFNRGHRIRVTVASTGAPFYEPNPNTGEPLTLEPAERTVVATNTLHHDRVHASRIIAPVRRAE
jgi:putative CocE/NonD family hydrolase